jgi:hypothetical protein
MKNKIIENSKDKVFHEKASQPAEKIFRIIGILLLVIGIGFGLLATAEMYCYYLFSPGGRMHYDGFGFGSFMFGLIAAQNIGFYVISFLLIVIGYGHFSMKKWIVNVSIAFLHFWLITGIPVIGIAFFILAGVKDMSIPVAVIILLICILFYFPIPSLLIRFYKNKGNTALSVDKEGFNKSRIMQIPDSVLTLIFLLILIILSCYIIIFFNCIFPVFGSLIQGIPGILIIDIVTAWLIILVCGLSRMQKWSWWGTVITLGMLTISTISTFLNSSYQDILAAMNFPDYEMTILEKIPAQGYHFALLTSIILLPAFILAISIRKHYFHVYS